jgi:hypothetical protein
MGGIPPWMLYWFSSHRSESAIRDLRMAELESKFAVLSQAVVPISAAFQAVLVKQLTHLHTPVLDALLIKLGPPNILTDEDETILVQELHKRISEIDDQVDEYERDAARMLPMVIRRVKNPAIVASDTLMQVVLVPPPSFE